MSRIEIAFLLVATFIAGMVVQCVWHPVYVPARVEEAAPAVAPALPPGYFLTTNGEEFRYNTEETTSIISFDSIEKASKYAWKNYEKEKHPWVPVPANKEASDE